MKNPMLHFTFCLLSAKNAQITLVFFCVNLWILSSISHASPPISNEAHFHGVHDHEDMRVRDSLYVATKQALNLNVGEPRTVRMIYFLPNDRPFRQDVVDSMKTMMRRIQTFYADQMQAHGYEGMAFRYETDAQGEPLVHRVDGQHPDSHYLDWPRASAIWGEIEQAFDLEANVYLIVIDNSIDFINTLTGPAAGVGQWFPKNGGWGMVSGSFGWRLVAHELGHGFGLQHDFRDGAYIMSYGGVRDRLSACNAEFLAAHPHFNTDIPTEETSPPTIELIPSSAYPRSAYPTGSTSVSLQFKVSDSDGLHQVFLFVHTLLGAYEVYACRGMAGETDAIVEFDFNGVYPSGSSMSLSDVAEHDIWGRVLDRHGNFSGISFWIFENSPHYLATLEGHTNDVNSLAFSPDGTILASGSYDGTVKLWDVKTKQGIATLEGHTNQVRSLAFSPDGTILASGSYDGTVKLWDVKTKQGIATLEGHTNQVRSLAFSPDGTILASGSYDGTVKLWDVKTKQGIATLEGHTNQVRSLAFSPDGAILASGSYDGTVKLWDVKTKQSIATLEGHKAMVEFESVAFSPDGTILASGSYDDTGFDYETVKLWDVKTKQNIATFAPKWGTYSVAFSSDGTILASSTHDRIIILWDIATQTQIATLGGHTTPVRSIAFSPDGTTLASGDFDGNVLLWDMSEYVTPVVIFADANLRAVIRDALDKSDFAPITVPDMARLTTLDASNRNIRELDGLEFATQLTDLNLGGNPLSSSAVSTHIPALQERGVTVVFDKQTTPDFSGDGAVDIADFLLFVAQFGLNQDDEGYDARFDLDGDGVIGLSDFLIFVNAFGTPG